MGKLIVLFFFVVAVVVFALVKYAARGVRAGYSYVNERERLANEALQQGGAWSSTVIQKRLGLDGAASSSEQDNALLRRFEARLCQQGFGPTSFNEPGAGERICGLLAGQFAKLVNGRTLVPSRPFSNHDLAVAWVGAVAVDVATQSTATDFELAGLAVAIPLVDSCRAGANPDKAADEMMGLVMSAFQLHNKLATSGEADETAALIARSFMDWATDGRDAGLFALRRSLPKLAATIGSVAA